MTDLKPCPFCSAEPSVVETIDNNGHRDRQVSCMNTHCPGAGGWSPVSLWNTRAVGVVPEQLAALVAALRTQRQIDMDGCEVAVSRQACDEAADAIEHLQAEVARLSTPPDDAETREGPQIAGYTCAGCVHFRSEYWKEPDGEGGIDSGTSATCAHGEVRHISSYYGMKPSVPDWCPVPKNDHLTRLSHALAAETAKREAMEVALNETGCQSTVEWDSDLQRAVEVSMGEDEMGEIARATLAKHGSK